jgi:stage II sporulation protein D
MIIWERINLGRIILWVIVLVIIATVVFPFIIVNISINHFAPAEQDRVDDDKIGMSLDDIQSIKINFYNEKVGKLEEIPLEEYIKGVVAAEMPALFEPEALKAQAVAARTYAVNKMQIFGKGGCDKHPGADICSDSAHCQAWESVEEQKKKWGMLNYYVYSKKIAQAVDDTAGEIITYDDQPILPAFHAISGGKTENSGDVWSQNLPYLKSVTSDGEESAPKFTAEKNIPVQNFISSFKAHYPNANINAKNIKNSISILDTSEGGRVKDIKVGDVTIKGTEFRSIYDLNSTNFKIYFNGNNIKIVTVGYGHGVGMSQYGANSMAKNGNTYQEILKHYYTGVEIKDIASVYAQK